MKHAKLSASGSHRWISCPGSVAAEEGIPDFATKASQAGSDAHLVATMYFENFKDCDYKNTADDKLHNELVKCTSYIRDKIVANQVGRMWLEHPVCYDNITKDGYGTADTIFVKPEQKELHIADFKYGTTVVPAKDNTQLLLYAIGALNKLSNDYNIEAIILHIMQPRIDHFDSWSLTLDELRRLEDWLRQKASEALAQNAPRIASKEACMWCKAKTDCPEYKDYKAQQKQLKKKEFSAPFLQFF